MARYDIIYKMLDNPRLIQEIRRLSEKDNYTNFIYLIRAYIFIAAVIGGTLWFYFNRDAYGLSFWWNIPVTFAAFIGVGIGQHQLGGLGHEGLHHMLFKNRYLSEIISDLFCMFPILGLTYFFRLEHLGHHQFVNDAKQDPDVTLLKKSHLWFGDAMSRKQTLRKLAILLYIPNLVRYMLIRTGYIAFINDKNPYRRATAPKPHVLNWSFIAYFIVLMILNSGLIPYQTHWERVLYPNLAWVVLVSYYMVLPNAHYNQSRFRPVLPLRALMIMRATYFAVVLNGLLWTTHITGHPAIAYFVLLWIVPGYTSFGFVTALQQGIQHANTDSGWLTNSRVFIFNNLINFCLFPVSLGYHQPHHMYPSVPHFRLRKLHRLLMDYPEYRDNVGITEGYFFSPRRKKEHPTAMEALSPTYTLSSQGTAFVDQGVVAEDRIDSV